jgi:endonuclease-3 related protein
MTSNTNTAQKLITVYEQLLACYGPQHWWPGDTPFEIMVGAILTQSAAWGNVEKAIGNLKAAGKLSAAALREIPFDDLARIIYPSGYYNAKAKKLKALVEWLGRYNDDLSGLDKRQNLELRQELLNVHGIGPETADAILLYALRRPVFVIDAYTRRLFTRIGVRPGQDTYEGWQTFLSENLPNDGRLFNEYHALIVRHGKEQCHKKPLCKVCCISDRCPSNGRFNIQI